MKTKTSITRVMGAVERFLRRDGTPDAEAEWNEEGDPFLHLDTAPQLKGGDYRIVYVIVNSGTRSDRSPELLTVGAKTLEMAHDFELAHVDRIEARIHFEEDAMNHATVYVKDGTGPRGNVYKLCAYAPLPPGEYTAYGEGDENVRGPSEVAVGLVTDVMATGPAPKKAAERDRAFSSVDDLRKALQRGDFTRR
jgi:hypothetical protein